MIVISGISLILLMQPISSAFAQDEEGFVRRAFVTRTDAIFLSAVFPGLGQMTIGNKYKGMTFFLAESISLIFAINANENYNTKKKVYSRDLADFYAMANRGNYDTAYTAYKDLKSRNSDLNNLNTTRNTALVIAVAVYAYNIFDSILFLPSTSESKKVDSYNNRLKVSSTMIDRNPGILLSKSF
jgi:hypothetical protein